MNKTNFVKAMVCAAVLVGLAALSSYAQRGQANWWRRYDPAAETTIKGIVEEVKQIPNPRGSASGTHLLVKTEQGLMEVHLGPTDYIEKQSLTFAKGDQLEVIGAKVKNANADALIAREVKKGGQTFTLRNAQGIPAWSRGRRK